MLSIIKIFFTGANNAKIRQTESLQVSNFITNEKLPTSNLFGLTSTDVDNIRIEIEGATTEPRPTLEVLREGSRVVGPVTYRTVGGSGNKWRSHFLRLVSDTSDVAASGHGYTTDPNNQTILVQLGDIIKAKFSGKEILLPVGRPVVENNNGSNHRKHDIRVVQLAIKIFKNSAGNPCVTRNAVNINVTNVNERYAQSTVKFVANIDMGGTGDPGVTLPVALVNGYTGGNLLNPPNTDETALLALKDSNVNTVDIFYVDTITNGGGRATSYPEARNQSGISANSNWVVVASNTAGGSHLNTLPHELAHILINSPHRMNEPPSSLLRGGTTLDKRVNGTKRLDPYPQAAAAGVGNDDTTTIRTNSETLPV